jgi:hypothetical protein
VEADHVEADHVEADHVEADHVEADHVDLHLIHAPMVDVLQEDHVLIMEVDVLMVVADQDMDQDTDQDMDQDMDQVVDQEIDQVLLEDQEHTAADKPDSEITKEALEIIILVAVF